LPLKKGQTLVSGIGNGGTRIQNSDSGQAVVLALRKRYSMVRRGVRQMTTGRLPTGGRTFADEEQNEAQELSVGTSDPTSANPWHDARPGPSRRSQTAPQPLHHRLSYDHASGVIMLPEGENWLMSDEDSDSEEDYGTPSPQEETPASPAVETSPGVGASALPSNSQTPTTSPLKRRSLYSTYYHHPERRSRQTLPGAFEQGD
jgi:calcium permeable stress-gated cation channel